MYQLRSTLQSRRLHSRRRARRCLRGLICHLDQTINALRSVRAGIADECIVPLADMAPIADAPGPLQVFIDEERRKQEDVMEGNLALCDVQSILRDVAADIDSLMHGKYVIRQLLHVHSSDDYPKHDGALGAE